MSNDRNVERIAEALEELVIKVSLIEDHLEVVAVQSKKNAKKGV